MSKGIHLRPKLDKLDDIPTTEYSVNNEKRVAKLSMVDIPPNPSPVVPDRMTQSFGAGKTRSPTKKTTVSVIDENNETVEYRNKSSETPRFDRNNSTHKSNSKNPYRRSDKSSIQNPTITIGIDNNAFVPSRPSSMYGGSLNSLPVLREQYCCFNRWTKREKLLFIISAALSFIVVGLIIAVGNLVDPKTCEKSGWVPMSRTN